MKKTFLLVLTALFFVMAGCEEDVPTGDGVFSVSPTQKVRIAPGNLVYDTVARTYSFAAHQFDYGDYFRWSSGGNPTTMSFSWLDYESFDDWGSYMEGGWRTLTADEWRYLIGARPNYEELCASATVCGVKGLVLLPDNFTGYVRTIRWAYTDNEYDADEWAKMEAAGVVFLPAAGYQASDSHVAEYTENSGRYWSCTPDDVPPMFINAFEFSGMFDEVSMYNSATYGLTVRLAKNI